MDEKEGRKNRMIERERRRVTEKAMEDENQAAGEEDGSGRERREERWIWAREKGKGAEGGRGRGGSGDSGSSDLSIVFITKFLD